MQNNIHDKQYRLIEAWKLFAEQGIYKTEYLENAELKLWQQSKLLGANPLLDTIDLKSIKDIQNKIEFDRELNSWSEENAVSIMLIDNEKHLINQSSYKFDDLKAEIGAFFDERVLGISCLTLSLKSGEYGCLKGGQHFLKAFQYYVTRSYPKNILDKEYFFFCIHHINNDDSSKKSEIEKQIDLFIERISGNTISGNAEEKEFSFRHFESGVYEISSNGKIGYTDLSNLAILPEGQNILSVFPDCSISDIFSGKKQVLRSTAKSKKIYLLSPISKNNQFTVHVLIEKMAANFDIFEPYHKILNGNMSSFINKNNLSVEIVKRLKALSTSSMPVLFIIENVYEQLIFSTYIESLRSNCKTFYINLDSAKYSVKSVEKRLEEIKKWSMKDDKVSIHILNLDLIDENQVYKIIDDCFQSDKKNFKYLFYTNSGYYEKFIETKPNILSSFKLNIMRIEKDMLDEINNSFDNNILLGKNDETLKLSNKESKVDSSVESDVYISRFKKDKKYSLKEIEKEAIIDALMSVDYNISRATHLLGISRSTLYRKIKEYEIETS